MPLQLYSFNDFVAAQVIAMQASANEPLDFEPGADFLAFTEANAGNALALQSQNVYNLAVSRAQTSYGNDLDTWCQQFQFFRKEPTNAYSTVTFSRFTPTAQAIIPAGSFDLSTQGALVYSPISGITYSVYADTTHPNYDPLQEAYIVPVNTASITVPIIATVSGSLGNVLAGQINTIYSTLINIDTVTNPENVDNGEDEETDAQYRARFVLYINGLSKANYDAVAAAILTVPGVQRYKLVPFYDVDDNPLPAFFYAVIDDGTGNASGTLLANVQAAVLATRGLGIATSIYAPIPFEIDISAQVLSDGSVPNATIQAAAQQSLFSYIESQSFNATFYYSEIPRIIYNTNNSLSGKPDSPIINVSNYLLNGGTSDIAVVGREIMVPGTIEVAISV